MNYKLYYSLLGDYYLHAFLPTHKHEAVSNHVSLKIHSHIDSIDDKINNLFLGINNKFKLKLLIAELTKENKIEFKDIFNLPKKPKALISYLSDRVLSPKELGKLMLQERTKKTLIYSLESESIHLNKIIGFEDFDVDLDIHNLISKYLMFSNLNKQSILKLISGLLAVPLAYDEEIIVKYTKESVITNKNTYPILHEVYSEYDPGTVLKPFEPVYLIADITTKNYISNSTIKQIESLSNSSFYAFYMDKVIEAIKAMMIYIAIPLNNLLDKTSIFFIQDVLSRISFLKCTLYSNMEDKSNFNAIGVSNTIMADKAQLSIKDVLSIDVISYKNRETIQTKAIEKPLIKTSSSLTGNFSTESKALLLKNEKNDMKISEETFFSHLSYIKAESEYSLKSTKLELALAKTKDNDLFKYKKEDTLSPTDKLQLNSKHEENLTIEDDFKGKILYSKLDTLNLPVDSLRYRFKKKETAKTVMRNIEIGNKAYYDNLFIKEQNSSKITDVFKIQPKDSIKSNIFDKETIRMYNLELKQMSFSQQEKLNISEININKNIIKETLKTLDELTVDTDTKIDE